MTPVQPPHTGPGWAELASLQPLAAVLDPGDSEGAKNRIIHATHLHALRHELGSVCGLRALDVGCGTGRLSSWLLEQGVAVVGVDATRAMVDVARANVPGAEFHEADAARLPLDDSEFDLAVTAYVLQYYVGGRADADAIVSELRRVLAPGGRLFAIEQVSSHDLGRGGTADDYAAMFEAGGFSVQAVRSVRLGNSVILRHARRHRRWGSLPGTLAFLAWEARLMGAAALRRGSYVDALFVTSSGKGGHR